MAKDIIEKIAEAPAEALDKTVTQTGKVAKTLHGKETLEMGKETIQKSKDGIKKSTQKTKEFWHTLGPGLTTGASDDDPSGIATYSQAGAKYGFQLLWLSFVTFPMMAAVQEMCARIGLVTGRGLAGNIRLHFSKKILYMCTLLLFVANAVNIGADLGAMAEATRLLNPGLSFNMLVILFALFSIAMQIFTPYAQYAKYLKWLALVLFTYIFAAMLADINWGEVWKAVFSPQLEWNKDLLLLVCAILGTTISPYLFFWQTSQEVEEQIVEGKTNIASRSGATGEEVKKMRADVWTGMFLSNLVMFFIIAACGAVLFSQGITDIKTAGEAAAALEPFAGESSKLLFSIGIIGTGLLAIPVLAGSSSYAVSESMRWRKSGLNKTLKQAHAFYGVIIISILIGLGINFLGIDPIKALIYSAVFNGLVAPVILALIVLLSSNKKIMGDWVNKPFTTAFGWGVTAIMAIAGLGAIYSLF